MNTRSDQNRWRGRLTTLAPLFIWLGVIFYLSSGSGSMSETSRIIGPLVRFLFPSADEAFVVGVHSFIRKTAHVTEYAILAALASRAFLASSYAAVSKGWALCALALVALTASIDEINQSFNAQRTGSPRDVLLDISGGLLAIALIYIVRRRLARTRGPSSFGDH